MSDTNGRMAGMRRIKTLIGLLILGSLISNTLASSAINASASFQNIELIEANGEKLRERSVRVVFDETTMRVFSRADGSLLKEWSYDRIKSAEYSYSKNPRWKTGLGLGAASVVFPPLLLIAIPIGFTKHRRHWVTVRTENDYAVMKVGKGVRKVFMPAFETRTHITIKALGDDK